MPGVPVECPASAEKTWDETRTAEGWGPGSGGNPRLVRWHHQPTKAPPAAVQDEFAVVNPNLKLEISKMGATENASCD